MKKTKNKQTDSDNSNTTLDTLTGTITRLYFSSPTFSAGVIQPVGISEPVKFSGKVYLEINQKVNFRGKYITHPKFGEQFEVVSLQYQLDTTAEGLIAFLAKDDTFKNIGPVRARKIVEQFASSSEAWEANLKDETTRQEIATIAKVPVAVIDALSQSWLESSETNRLMAWLSQYELSPWQCRALAKVHGQNAVSLLQLNPYLIIRTIDNFGFKRVDQIALKMGFPKNHPTRIAEGVLFCVSEELNSGSTWIERRDLISLANKLLVIDTLDSEDLIEAQIDQLTESGRLVFDHDPETEIVKIGFPRVKQYEEFLAETFDLASRPNPHFNRYDIETFIDPTSPLNTLQLVGLRTALTSNISLITGAAGTGKSFSVTSIYKACLSIGLHVELCAPTGKAAQRLRSISGAEGKTIHRLLGYNGTSWEYNEDNPLETDVLIIDELSMVDIEVVYHLFSAINLDKTMVVMMGDHHQLPPVGYGSILRDLVVSQKIPTTILTEIMRSSGDLRVNSNKLLSGYVAPTSPPRNDTCREWYLVNSLKETISVETAINQLFTGHLTTLGYDIVREVQLITPTHKGPIGTVALNRMVQTIVHGPDTVAAYYEGKKETARVFIPGDKVIQTKNDYELEVMNGTIGYVTKILSSGNLIVGFEIGTKDADLHTVTIKAGSPELSNISLAYALTVHKTQGSEFPCVIIIVHKSHSFMHHRGLFYTGVTRAQQTVIILGDSWGIHNCAKKVTSDNRRTWLPGLMNLKAVRA